MKPDLRVHYWALPQKKGKLRSSMVLGAVSLMASAPWCQGLSPSIFTIFHAVTYYNRNSLKRKHTHEWWLQMRFGFQRAAMWVWWVCSRQSIIILPVSLTASLCAFEVLDRKLNDYPRSPSAHAPHSFLLDMGDLTLHKLYVWFSLFRFLDPWVET